MEYKEGVVTLRMEIWTCVSCHSTLSHKYTEADESGNMDIGVFKSEDRRGQGDGRCVHLYNNVYL